MADLTTYRLVWPREVLATSVGGALRHLAAGAATPVVLDAIGRESRVEHRLHIVGARSANVLTQLRSSIAGLGMEHIEAADDLPGFGLALTLTSTTRRRSFATELAEPTSAGVLRALARARGTEVLLLRWQLITRLAPSAVPSNATLAPESLPARLAAAVLQGPRQTDADTRSALRDKQREPGWRVLGCIAAAAKTPARRKQLAHGVLAALRVAEAPGVRLRARRSTPSMRARSFGRAPLVLNVSELAALASWPLGLTSELPVARLGSRRLPVPAGVPETGRVLGASTWPAGVRPIAVSPTDGLRHLVAIGPTGTGKSTLLLKGIESDMAAGRALVVLDGKGDLITDVLARVPKRRVDDVVVIATSGGDEVVGLNPLAPNSGTSPEIAADAVLTIFKQLSGDAAWGPRLDEIMSAALLTLARVGGHSLLSVPPLLTDAGFRRRVLSKLDDRLGLGPFWAQFERWSEAERLVAVAPVLRRLRPFMVRAGLRRMVGQPTPGFDFAEAFASKRLVLVDLAKGKLGEEAARLLGALTLSLAWQAGQARIALPSDKRHPVSIVVDEFQEFMALPVALEDALAQARSLGLGFTLATQYLKRLTPSLRAGLANARSQVAFQLGHEDAREFAQGQTLLSAEDFMTLDAHHFYARLMANDQVQPWCSGQTYSPSEPTNDPNEVRRLAAERYGRNSADIDTAIEAMLGTTQSPDSDLGPRRRGGSS